MESQKKILVKFPSRSRPEKFFNALDLYIKKSTNPQKIAYLCSFDNNDLSMNNAKVLNKLNEYKTNTKYFYWFYGDSKTKIEAVNADVDKVAGWDILVLASDDMIPIEDGWDNVVRNDMNSNFPNTDGVIWYSDGGQNNINTLCILGKKYYDRFGYIYHPDYISLWSDNEFTDVSLKLDRCYRSERVIIDHQHPVYQKTTYDELYLKNEGYFRIDQLTYEKRKLKNFDLPL